MENQRNRLKNILVFLEFQIGKIFAFFENHFLLTVIILFFISLAVRLYLTPYHLVLRKDAYAYLLDGLEMAKSNFSPRLEAPPGWPLFLSPFLYIFGRESIFQNMINTRIISDIIGAINVFPLAYIGKKVLGKKSLIILLVIFIFVSPLIMSSISALSEPMFLFLLLMMVLFIMKSSDNQKYILVAALFGGIAYYVRFNGILLLLIILFSFFLLRKQIPEFKYRYFIYILLVFFAVAAHFLYQRYINFGSFFFYGEVSKYFVDSYQYVWSYNIPVPSLIDYIRTHTIIDYFNKFVIHGFFSILFHYVWFVIPAPLLFFFLHGLIERFHDKKFLPFFAVFLIWILGLVIPWDMAHTPRYLEPTIPFILIFSVAAIYNLFKDYKYKHIILSLFLVIFVIFSLLEPVQYWYQSQRNDQNELEWGRWIAQNVQGRVAMFNGDIVMMNLPDTKICDKEGLTTLYSPQANLSVINPGYFDKLTQAMQWFMEKNVTHIALDEITINRRPYFKEIYQQKKIPPYLTEVYSNYDTDSNWKIRVYSFNYSEFTKISNLENNLSAQMIYTMNQYNQMFS